jgi:hypothetical protein
MTVTFFVFGLWSNKLIALASPLSSWSVLIRVAFLAALLACLYGFLDYRWRDLLSGDLCRLRGMRRTGAPASLRTHVFTTLFWANAVLITFGPPYWYPNRAIGVVFIGLIAAGMLSSRADVGKYRGERIEGWRRHD